jgi:8-oxo-dGTP pyrophosphatase MutT (NUDIX family)
MGVCGKYSVDEIRNILNHRERKVIEHPSFPRAAVLLPLYAKDGGCHLLFTKRTYHVKHHKGEISFPGGMFDKEDADLERTALREASEEIGLGERDARILGTLDDIVTVTEFVVTPFVGVVPYPYPFKLSPVEIAELIEVPLAMLLDPGCFGEREILQDNRKRMVEAYQYKNHSIWGATARILKQFLDLISSPETTHPRH